MKTRLVFASLLVVVLATGLLAPAAGAAPGPDRETVHSVLGPGPDDLQKQFDAGAISEKEFDAAGGIIGGSVAPDSLWPGPDGFNYVGQAIAFSWVDITATGTLVTGWTSRDDGYAGPFPIGFSFGFYGSPWTDFYAGSNGFLSFGAGSTTYTNQCPLPSSTAPNNIIPILWDDLNLSTSGDAYYQTFDPCPIGSGKCLVVEYYNAAHFGGAAGSAGTWEAILFEDGSVVLQFLDSGGELGSGSTTGMENNDAAADYGLTYACNAANSITDGLALLIAELTGPALGDSSKTAPGHAVAGEPFEYAIAIRNTGVDPAQAAEMVDPLPAGTTYVPDSLSCSAGTCAYDAGLNQVTWAGAVAVGETVDVSFSVVAEGACGAPVVNQATINDPEAMAPAVVGVTTMVWDMFLGPEGFEGDTFPPAGWTEAHEPSGAAWTDQDLEPRGNLTGGSGKFAIVDDDYPGSAALTTAQLWTPAFDIPAHYATWLIFKTDYNNLSANESANVDISTDGGTTWTTLLHWNGDHRGPLTQQVDLTAFAGQTGANVRFYYDDGDAYAWWWEVDDVLVASCYVPLPNLVIEAPSLDVQLSPDQTKTLEMELCNTGDADLSWALSEVEPPRGVQAVLWDNGPLVTHPGGGSGGADASALQTALGMDTYGFGNQFSVGNRMADDFEVDDPAGWAVEQITFFGYQSFAPVSPSPITGLYYQIWDGPPNDPGSSVVFGDLTTNRLASSTFANIYRVLDTDLTNADRAVMANVATAGVTLPPGAYWLDWMTDGSASYTGPWAPPVSILGQTTTGNALQYTGTWAAALDGGTATPQGMPFVVEGEVAGPPPDLPWLSENPTGGTVAPAACQVVDLVYDSTALPLGLYTGSLLLESNDPDTPEVELPVSLEVVEVPSTHIDRMKARWHTALIGGYRMTAIVRIRTNHNLPAEGAIAYGEWTLPDGSTVPQQSYWPADELGIAKFRLQSPQVGTYTFCLTDIVHDGFVYDPEDDRDGPCKTAIVEP